MTPNSFIIVVIEKGVGGTDISNIVMGQRIRAARKARNVKADELAEAVGIAVESIGHIECGARRPSLMTLFRIAETLDVSLDYLTGRTDDSTETVISDCADHQDLTPEQKSLLLELSSSLIPVIKKRFYIPQYFRRNTP